ncbi:hypothetical protein [Streptosporangium sp. NPDC006007]|uniref:hypothetical protein n=1 Tax=Streptosporangium sp. NPDC006007 TaxID=3154575 RepID=UPI0033BC1741
MIRTVGRELGLTTVRCTVLTALAAAAFTAALFAGLPALYGVAGVVAFVAGSTWGREVCCDACHTSLEG